SSSVGPHGLKVEGAGFAELDGRYYRARMADGVPCYAQRDRNELARAPEDSYGLVYRVKADGTSAARRKWVICLIQRTLGNEGQSHADQIPFYENYGTTVVDNCTTPPQKGWQCVPGVLPHHDANRAPVVLMESESAMDMDDGNEDDGNFDNDDASTETPAAIPSPLDDDQHPVEDMDMMVDTSNNNSPASPGGEGRGDGGGL
ncbi:unnamed protein product, partial [Ectocarpus sp. 8 AP-2014]